MKVSGSRCVFVSLLYAAGFLYLAEVAKGANEFRRCYNASVEMHCFDLQYDNISRNWLTASFDNARQRCNNLSSTLIIIKDEETNTFVNNYITDPSSPIRFQNVWTDAYRINDYNNSYTWHWVNSKLPTIAAPEVGYDMYIWDSSYYTTTLECRNDNGKPQFYLTAKRPQDFYSYLCEYSVSRCPSNGSNVIQITDRCYISFIAYVSWYEARNRCLKDGGDLASFANVTSVNFTSWLGSDTSIRFWIGLRFAWYIWKDIDLEAKFTKWYWYPDGDWDSLCLTTMSCSNCGQNLNWIRKDCNSYGSTYVACHSVTPLEKSTLTTTVATTALPETTSTVIKTTATGTRQSREPESNSSKNTESSPIALGVGVGVGVGVPVVVAIIVIVICVVRRHQSKKPEGSATRHEEETFPTDVHVGTSEGAEGSHYATIRSVSPAQPSMVENEPTPETEYAILGFNKAGDPKNNNGHIPLDVL